MTPEYDIIVVGGGHAGCEAAAAAARLGSRTLLVTMDMTKLADMSCNPAVGGVAKGQIVREIDALGGQMGVIADRSTVQFRMLNRSKGPAMWSPRAQCDKTLFSRLWRAMLEGCDNLHIWQDTVNELITSSGAGVDDDCVATSEAAGGTVSGVESGVEISATGSERRAVVGVRTRLGAEFRARAVILTAGTFLGGMMHIGRSSAEGGRAGDSASHGLTEQLRALGFESGRMKTGTPVRIDGRTIDFARLEPQYGDAEPAKFSFLRSIAPVPLDAQLPCYLAYTTPEVHEILRTGFADSPLFNGTIAGIGPRYCPSIEDKLRTFADKEQHQLFLEPEGSATNEYYLNGFSSSLPLDVQLKALRGIAGFENVAIFRPGYAIEYDFFPPTQLFHTLETKLVENLYFAGQINGTTGYEEAGAQGLMAGINAHLKLAGRAPLVLRRDEAYIGVLIDDLVTKGVDEPYRMFTSRAEFRILLRQDNADLRLTPRACEIDLATPERIADFVQKKSLVESLVKFLHTQSIAPCEIKSYLKSVHSVEIPHSRKAYELLLRNEITLDGLISTVSTISDFVTSGRYDAEAIDEAEIQIKYRGYIEREKHLADKLTRLENIRLAPDFDYNSLQSLTIEARQKLTRICPATIGQASRIPGVSPADINVLLVYFGR